MPMLASPVLSLTERAEAVIAAAASVSGTIRTGNRIPVAIVAPAAWTAAVITLETSWDEVEWHNVMLIDGTEHEVTVTADGFLPLDYTALIGVGPALRIRSGTGGVPVNQAAERTLFVVLGRPTV